ncbi:hypothetical protein FFLO_03902 [Filobasidium floriforme]|uniref:Uncharacterized protein n=1 Tax=Filobasidium floriforme TaxID=5210 RepID=A0A8K0NQE3_9TREE|nr:uncharacterized protein HD553DRAFT_310747 [Filobasidium floriforme]KAG7532027.1 hypothetical protein FFLO_03902 [Filobasidium floriforme]KAH8085195.1 hypothetical protein HD553DRAFT_310747 [Filobasidium floriforme]
MTSDSASADSAAPDYDSSESSSSASESELSSYASDIGIPSAASRAIGENDLIMGLIYDHVPKHKGSDILNGMLLSKRRFWSIAAKLYRLCSPSILSTIYDRGCPMDRFIRYCGLVEIMREPQTRKRLPVELDNHVSRIRRNRAQAPNVEAIEPTVGSLYRAKHYVACDAIGRGIMVERSSDNLELVIQPFTRSDGVHDHVELAEATCSTLIELAIIQGGTHLTSKEFKHILKTVDLASGYPTNNPFVNLRSLSLRWSAGLRYDTHEGIALKDVDVLLELCPELQVFRCRLICEDSIQATTSRLDKTFSTAKAMHDIHIETSGQLVEYLSAMARFPKATLISNPGPGKRLNEIVMGKIGIPELSYRPMLQYLVLGACPDVTDRADPYAIARVIQRMLPRQCVVSFKEESGSRHDWWEAIKSTLRLLVKEHAPQPRVYEPMTPEELAEALMMKKG